MKNNQEVLDELVEAMTSLEKDIESMLTVLDTKLDPDKRRQISLELEFKKKLITLSSERLMGITNLINSNSI